jgi:hypothetical protein
LVCSQVESPACAEAPLPLRPTVGPSFQPVVTRCNAKSFAPTTVFDMKSFTCTLVTVAPAGIADRSKPTSARRVGQLVFVPAWPE